MSEFEMDIGRNIGAAAFFVFQIIKLNPKSSVKDIALESGLYESTVRSIVGKLEDAKFINCEVVQLTRTRSVCKFTLNKDVQ